MKIVNRQPRVLGTCTGRRLLPGKNAYNGTPEELQKIVADLQFKSWQKLGWIVIINDPDSQASLPGIPATADAVASTAGAEAAKDESLVDALESLNVEQANDMIASCADLALLADWRKHDGRKGVRKAAAARIAELKGAETPEADADEG